MQNKTRIEEIDKIHQNKYKKSNSMRFLMIWPLHWGLELSFDQNTNYTPGFCSGESNANIFRYFFSDEIQG